MADIEENKRPMPIEHAMRSGLEVGVMFAVSFVLDAQSRNYGWLSIISFFVLFMIVYSTYISAQMYKEEDCGGQISFSEAYYYIIVLYLCSALVAAILRFVYMQWIDPSLLPSLYEQVTPVVREVLPTVSDDEVEALKMFYIPIRMSLFYVLYDVIAGSILGLIVAPMVRRRKMHLPFNKKDKN